MHILAALTEGTTPPQKTVKEAGAESLIDFESAFMDADEMAASEEESLIPTDTDVDLDQEENDEVVLNVSNGNDVASTDVKDVTGVDPVDAALIADVPKQSPLTRDPLPTDNSEAHKIVRNEGTTVPQSYVPFAHSEERQVQSSSERQSRSLPTGPLRTEPLVSSAGTIQTTTPSAALKHIDLIAQQVSLAPSQETSSRSVDVEVPPVPSSYVEHPTSDLAQIKPAVAMPQSNPAQTPGFHAVEAVKSPKANQLEGKAGYDEDSLTSVEPNPKSQQPVLQAGSSTMPAVPTMSQAAAVQTKVDPNDLMTHTALEGEADETLALSAMSRSDGPVTQSLIQPAVLQHPQLPQHIARQMAEVLQKGADGPVDVALSPEELGKVRMRISLQDGGIVINILAERAETLDLMRRNVDLLSQEFKDLGFVSVNFGFDTSDSETLNDTDDPSDKERSDDGRQSVITDTPKLSVSMPQTLTTQGVDIRL